MENKNKIMVVRLICGYDLITEVGDSSVKLDYMELIHPFRPMYTSNPDTGVTVVSLVQWLSYEMFEDYYSCSIPMSQILTIGPASETMIELYNKSKELYLRKISSGEIVTRVRTLEDIENDSRLESNPMVLKEDKRKLQ